MHASGYILMLLSLTGNPAITVNFETLEGCQAAARAVAAPGDTLAYCLPQVEPDSTTARGEAAKTPPKSPRRRVIPSKPGPPPLYGVLTPPPD